MQITQQGGVITGHYQGPGQEGALEGTINQQHILFRTKTRGVLTFRGRVDGPRTDHLVQGGLSAEPIETSTERGTGTQCVLNEKGYLRIHNS